MRFRYSLPVLAILFLCTAPAWAIDTVKTAKTSVSGSLTEMNKYTVKIKRGDREESFPVNEIEYVRLEGEPAQLNLVRNAVNSGRYRDALDGLEKVRDDNYKTDVKQEIEFFRAISTARLALAGDGAIADAGTMMNTFVQTYTTSWHYLEACEVLGDLLVAINKYPLAQQRYAELEQAPWPNVKMRGGVLKGRALQAEGKFDEATTAFDAVLKQGGADNSELVEAQKQAATIGKAVCLAQTGKHAEAIKMLEDVIAKADAEQSELHALAYNALGMCERKAGNNKGALLAYLHVHVLYDNQASAHAEALANLAQLWKEVGQPDRAAESEQLLADKYPSSKWNKKQ